MKPIRFPLRQQAGAALMVSLVMLLIVTLIGLASVRSATNQEKMSANMYDRALAYQAAEAALKAAEKVVLGASDPYSVGVDCIDDTSTCLSIPANTFNSNPGVTWTDVSTNFEINSALLSSKPQYYIERVGLVGGTDELGVGGSANCDNYAGCDETPPTALLYRITARSAKPSANDGRAIVAFQATIKQNL